MRVIKFRGLRTDGKGWVVGNFIQGKDGKTYIKIIGAESHQVHPETVGQFTGILDKNGVEIYEGDKLKLTSRSFFDYDKDDIGFYEDIVYLKIEDLTYAKCFYCSNNEKWNNGHSYSDYSDDWNEDMKTVEVIGNIHELTTHN